jgi:hypothetical protein
MTNGPLHSFCKLTKPPFARINEVVEFGGVLKNRRPTTGTASSGWVEALARFKRSLRRQGGPPFSLLLLRHLRYAAVEKPGGIISEDEVAMTAHVEPNRRPERQTAVRHVGQNPRFADPRHQIDSDGLGAPTRAKESEHLCSLARGDDHDHSGCQALSCRRLVGDYRDLRVEHVAVSELWACSLH